MDDTLFQTLLSRAKQPAPIYDTVERTSFSPDDATSQPESKSSLGDKVIKGMYFGGAGADVASTLYFQHHPELGIHEANPLVNWAPRKLQTPIGVGMEGLAYYLGNKFVKPNHPKLFNTLLGIAGAAHGSLAANNIRLIGNQKDEKNAR